ncbi:SDR family NAD(P)-dependent oxidoreductase [Roseomonas chloroacetimidivorans]|uniref:SDR family NAD(P)-dependent oxidoreductase n=1 Tax=Roseomonas chloroacetimidivorans TaxID=1766656 RepID=UPI003C7561F2
MRAEALFDVRGLATAITGGASGIGLAYAEVMARNGARVTIMDRDAAALEREAARLGGEGLAVRTQLLDVTDRAGLCAGFEVTAAHYGRLDVVFANAGIDIPPGYLRNGRRDPEGAIDALADDTWDRVIAVNLTGVFLTIQAAARHMKTQGGGGSIIVTTSVAGQRTSALPGLPYMPAKAGAAHLMRQAALELARYDIRVNAIAPGTIVTNIGGGHSHEEATQAAVAQTTPLRRIGQPREVMGAALLLASPASSYITGAEIVVDGGRMLGLADPS